MATDMRKTPSRLRGLAESRARTSAEIERLEHLLDNITEQLERAKIELEATDGLIRKFDTRLNPERIEPIFAWKGRYGARGALKAAISGYVKDSAPGEVSTSEIAGFIEHAFSLEFATRDDRDRWRRNSINSCLKQLMREGVVERCHEPNIGTIMGWWRWKSTSATLEALANDASNAGIAVQHNRRKRGRPKVSAAV